MFILFLVPTLPDAMNRVSTLLPILPDAMNRVSTLLPILPLSHSPTLPTYLQRQIKFWFF
ncbi:hypothetical protein BLD44_004790 [Mastigocladus laminosus UU774]|nr:hypothetical protein BLD44_004790 [Mastigocladus laminosus UU774]